MPEELETEATQEETPPTTPPAEEVVAPALEPAAAVVDWKARAEKAENDLRSLRGSRQRQDDIHLTLQEIRSHQELLDKNQRAMLKALQTGESEGLAAEVAQNETQGGQAREDMQFQRLYNNQWGRLERTVTDKNGEVLPIFDIEVARRNAQTEYGEDAANFTPVQIVLLGAPELKPAIAAWRQSAPQGWQTPRGERDQDGLVRALAEAHEIVKNTLTTRHQRALAQAKGERAQSLDLTAGKEASGGTEFSGIVTEAQLDDPDYWEKNRDKILKARNEGKLTIK